ncbi:putative transferase, protein kinase RLK-Pelle-RLCK-VIIa-2 family [Helianthus debilis subsp. tardiflorus]
MHFGKLKLIGFFFAKTSGLEKKRVPLGDSGFLLQIDNINKNSGSPKDTLFSLNHLFLQNNQLIDILSISVQGDSSNRKGNNICSEIKEAPADFQGPSPNVKVCKLSDLRKATNEFSQDSLLGRGRSGKVFLGWVEENTLAPTKQDVGIAVAIKRLYEISSTGNAILMTKVNILGQLAHPNIIRLLGCCTHENERLLVYKYICRTIV